MIKDRVLFDGLLGTIRRFVNEVLIPTEAMVEENDAIPPSITAQMRTLGLHGMSIPERCGGQGLTMEEEVPAALETGRTSAASRPVFGTNNGIGSQGIIADGTDEQKTRWLPRMVSGDVTGSSAPTEPDVGSDADAVKTTPRREGEVERKTAVFRVQSLRCAA